MTPAELIQIQPPLVALLLLLGAAAKAVDRTGGGGPVSLLPDVLQRPAAVATALLEAVLAVALLVAAAPVGAAAGWAAAALFAASAALLAVVRRRDPKMSCGCFGGLSTEPVGWRTIARAAVLAVAAVGAAVAGGSGLQALVGLTGAQAVVGAAELGVLAALSPELREAALRTLGRESCAVRRVPVRRTLSRLRTSDVWRANQVVVDGTEPVDVWRHGCWRLMRFTGRRNGRPVDAVFAVELRGRRPRVRAAVSDAETMVTLAVLGEVAEEGGAPLPRTTGGAPQATGTVVPTVPPAAPAPAQGAGEDGEDPEDGEDRGGPRVPRARAGAQASGTSAGISGGNGAGASRASSSDR
ncbi:MauE/DoxX family redox-associated membrane protein [Nocardiopsis chromatogenes]|uniref:MauE/DoxX family redox-associated membrane protein n=1 Tax=Nocardiopsis chromatogenes TaxID=280239 RepID=UPI000349494F|nr:MauE/DoxX family redox-associated membrane protein [Nocardiopsis chromatogenes]